MSDINWTTAPEGATHYNNNLDFPWLKEKPASFWMYEGWLEYHCEYPNNHFTKAVKRPVSEIPEKGDDKGIIDWSQCDFSGAFGWSHAVDETLWRINKKSGQGEEMKDGKCFKDVSGYDVIDAYRVHRLFGVTDEILCDVSEKILLSGDLTGDTLEQEVMKARDLLNRWLDMLEEEDKRNQQIVHQGADGWTHGEIKASAFKDAHNEYTLKEVLSNILLSVWARWVAADADGQLWEFDSKPTLCGDFLEWRPSGELCKKLGRITPPLHYTKCIWELKS